MPAGLASIGARAYLTHHPMTQGHRVQHVPVHRPVLKRVHQSRLLCPDSLLPAVGLEFLAVYAQGLQDAPRCLVGLPHGLLALAGDRRPVVDLIPDINLLFITVELRRAPALDGNRVQLLRELGIAS